MKKIISILILVIYMSLPVWGQLQKAQDDPETIEEAITRIMQEHDDDANAHLDDGQSLKSHKASEIIDHLAFSIVADKYSQGSIPYSAFSNVEIQFYTNFDTFDGWSDDELAGTIYKSAGCLGARVGKIYASAGEVMTSFGSSGPNVNDFDNDKNFYFKLMGRINLGSSNGLVLAGPLYRDSSGDDFNGFGLKFTSTKVYLTVADPDETITNEHNYELSGIDPTAVHLYEVSYNADDGSFVVLVDGVEVLDVTPDDPPNSWDYMFTFYVKEDVNKTGYIDLVQLYISREI